MDDETSSGVVYGSRSVKRVRRTKADLNAVVDAIHSVLAEEPSMTVRQVFYRLVSMEAIEKTELQYRAVVRILTGMRRGEEASFDKIADNTRWMHKPASYRDAQEALTGLVHGYRRDKWTDQPLYVEVWLEKDALAGVLYSVTGRYDVPLMVTRGFPSITFLHASARTIAEIGKPAKLLYFGDHDPSGADITRAVADGIHEFAPEADAELRRVALTESQIEELSLPTRPTKAADPRSGRWEGDSVELDAIPPKTLRLIADKAIASYIDQSVWNKSSRVEERERRQLAEFVATLD
jgi:hypothetical protein